MTDENDNPSSGDENIVQITDTGAGPNQQQQMQDASDDTLNDGSGGEGADNIGNTAKPKVTVAAKPKVTIADWTPDQMAQLAARVAKQVNAPAAAPRQQEQLSPEQLDKLLNPVKFDANLLKRIRGEDEADAVKAFTELSQSIVKNSTSVSRLMLEQQYRELMQQATPLQEFVQQQTAERYKTDFFGRHPKLKKFDKFVRFAASQVVPTKADGSDKTVHEAMDDIAGVVKEMLKETGVDLDAQEEGDGDNNSQESNTNRSAGSSSVPKMASLQQSGRGGGSGGKGGGKPNPDADIYT